MLFAVLSITAKIQAQTTFFVSVRGNDASRGTQAMPFASINRAVIEARKTPGKVVINLLQGTYYLNQPIVFKSQDSQKENETLTLTSFENQKVTLSGGFALNLTWKEYKNGIWQAKVTQDLIFDELFVNGQ